MARKSLIRLDSTDLTMIKLNDKKQKVINMKLVKTKIKTPKKIESPTFAQKQMLSNIADHALGLFS